MTENDFVERQQDAAWEIDSARPDELDTVLEVMCAAFELPYEIARPLYYADPYLTLENKRVLRVGGRIVSCLTITELKCRIDNGILDLAGIAGVATLPEYRRKGYASRLLASTITELRARGMALTGLFPYQTEYYRRLGWETAGSLCRYVTSPACLPAYTEAHRVQTVQPADFEPIAGLYAQTLGRHCLSVVRDARRWQSLHERVKAKRVFNVEGRVEGYLFYEIQPGTVRLGTVQAETPPTLRILEMAASTPRAQRALIGYLARQSQVGRIEYQVPWEGLRAAGLLDVPWVEITQSASIPVDSSAHVDITCGLMLRIVDFFTLLQGLLSNWQSAGSSENVIKMKSTSCIAMELRLQDELHSGRTQSILIAEQADGVPGVTLQAIPEILPIDQAEGEAAANPKRAAFNIIGEVEGEARVWAQVVVGHLSGDEACSLALLRASSPEVARWLGHLFPSRTPSLSTLDL